MLLVPQLSTLQALLFDALTQSSDSSDLVPIKVTQLLAPSPYFCIRLTTWYPM